MTHVAANHPSWVIGALVRAKATVRRIMEATFAARLAAYRDLRREIETNVLPLAGSVDGRRFTLQAPADGLRLRVGGYVALEHRTSRGSASPLAARSSHTDAGEIGWSGGDDALPTHARIRLVQGEGVVLDGPSPEALRPRRRAPGRGRGGAGLPARPARCWGARSCAPGR